MAVPVDLAAVLVPGVIPLLAVIEAHRQQAHHGGQEDHPRESAHVSLSCCRCTARAAGQPGKCPSLIRL
jgi:hypothetical protein